MNISGVERRVLHVLAQGGLIRRRFDERGKITEVFCLSRDGYVLSDCDLTVSSKLRRKRLIESIASSPYRISHVGRALFALNSIIGRI